MRKLFKERKLFKGGNYMRKYIMYLHKQGWRSENASNSFLIFYAFVFTRYILRWVSINLIIQLIHFPMCYIFEWIIFEYVKNISCTISISCYTPLGPPSIITSYLKIHTQLVKNINLKSIRQNQLWVCCNKK